MAKDDFFSLAQIVLLMVNIDPKLVDSLKTINPQSTSGEQQLNLPEYLSEELQSFILLCLNLNKKTLNPTIKDLKDHSFLKNVVQTPPYIPLSQEEKTLFRFSSSCRVPEST